MWIWVLMVVELVMGVDVEEVMVVACSGRWWEVILMCMW